jgi:hypothetical protein
MATAHGWIKWLMWINPMTYCVSLLNGTLHAVTIVDNVRINSIPDESTSFAITAAFGLFLLLTSGVMAARKSARSDA